MHKLRVLVYLIGLSLMITLPRVASASPPQLLAPKELDALLEKAETAEDHLKLAAHYSADAEGLESDAARHQALATRYRRSSLPPKTAPIHRGMAKHCNNLAQSLRNSAKAARQLAESHKAMADGLKK